MKSIVRAAIITILVLIIVQFALALFLREQKEALKVEEVKEYNQYVEHRGKIKNDSKRYDAFKKAIKLFYEKNGVLPRFVDDLDCKEGMCAEGVKDGVYYLVLENGVMATKPIINNTMLDFVCNTDIKGFGCYHKLSTQLPEFPRVSIRCNEGATVAEQHICKSDRLIHSYLLFEKAYENQVISKRRKVFRDYGVEKKNKIIAAVSRCLDMVCYQKKVKEANQSNVLMRQNHLAEINDTGLTEEVIDNMSRRECSDEACVIESMKAISLNVRRKIQEYERRGLFGRKDRLPMSTFLEFVDATEEGQLTGPVICGNGISSTNEVICDSSELRSLDRELAGAYNSLANIEADVLTEEIMNEKESFIRELSETCNDKKCIDISLKKKILDTGYPYIDDEVIIADASLEDCIRRKSSSENILAITKESFPIEYTSNLECVDKDIKTLAGIEQFKLLKRINISHNQVSDISPLSSMNLISLNLKANSVANIDAITGMGTLINLDIRDNPVVNISPVTTLPRIKEVTLSEHDNYSCRDLQNLVSREQLKILGKRNLNECDGKFHTVAAFDAVVDCKDVPEDYVDRTVCADSILNNYNIREKRLYSESLNADGNSYYTELRRKWLSSLRLCKTKNCLFESYLKRIKRIEAMSHSKYTCKKSDVPVVAYQSIWTSEMRDGLPVNSISQHLKDSSKVFYFTEMLGGAKQKITHRWLKDGVLAAEKSLVLSENKAGMWSVVPEVVSDSAIWEVQTVDQNGCEVMSSLLPAGTASISMKYNKDAYLLGKKEFIAAENSISMNSETDFELIRRLAENRNMEYHYSRSYVGDTPILQAVRANNIQVLKILLEEGVSPYVWDARGKSALEVARESGNKPVANLIRKAMKVSHPDWTIVGNYLDANINKYTSRSYDNLKNPVDCNTMTYMAKGHNVTHLWKKFNRNSNEWSVIFKDEIKVMADYEMVKSTHRLPEITAEWRIQVMLDGKELDLLEFQSTHRNVLKNSVFKKENVTLSSPLILLAKAWAPMSYYQAYFEAMGKGKMQKKINRDTMFGIAAISGNVGVLRRMLEEGISPYEGLMPQVLKARRFEVMRYLIASGMDINKIYHAWNEPERTLLHMAAANDDVMAIDLLIKQAAEIDVRDSNSHTPLHVATINCNLRAAKKLLEYGASKIIMTNRQETPEKLAQIHECGSDAGWGTVFSHESSNRDLK